MIKINILDISNCRKSRIGSIRVCGLYEQQGNGLGEVKECTRTLSREVQLPRAGIRERCLKPSRTIKEVKQTRGIWEGFGLGIIETLYARMTLPRKNFKLLFSSKAETSIGRTQMTSDLKHFLSPSDLSSTLQVESKQSYERAATWYTVCIPNGSYWLLCWKQTKGKRTAEAAELVWRQS